MDDEEEIKRLLNELYLKWVDLYVNTMDKLIKEHFDKTLNERH